MNKDLLEALGAVAREQERSVDDGRWEAFSRGELSVEAVAELEREAAADPELAELLELYRPIDSTARARIAEQLAGTTPQPAPLRQPISLRKRVPWALLPVAAAAALMFWLMAPAKLSPLPEYRSTAEGGQSTTRSAPASAGPIVLAPSSTLTWVLRPETGVDGNVVVHLFAMKGERLEELSVKPERAEAGAFRVRGSAAEIFGQRRGDWRLIAILGRPEALGGGADSKARTTADRGPGWQRVSVEVRLSDPD